MEYLRRVARDFTWNIFRKAKQEPTFEISRADAYLNLVYKILVWENPVLSWTTLGALHVLFWFIVYFQIRLYGFIFLTILVVFLTDLYFERSGLQAQRNASSDSIREVASVCNAIFLYLKSLRKDNPSLFCVTMCTIFLGLSMLSRNISGYFLTYLIMLATFFGPLLISKLPPEYKASIANAVHAFSTNEGVLAETELIPFLTDKETNDKDPELESLLTDKTADSITNSLISGINSMPSYLEAEGSLDGLEEDDLVPLIRNSGTSHTPAEYSSDSDSDHKNMRFDSAHFNGDSSSEDENNYSKGLRFSEVRDFTDSPSKLDFQAAVTQSLGAGLISNLAAMGTSFVANVLTSAGASNAPPKRKDSDSDFEFINSDEADEHT